MPHQALIYFVNILRHFEADIISCSQFDVAPAVFSDIESILTAKMTISNQRNEIAYSA